MTVAVIHLMITGRVQGVGYRAWLRDSAFDVGVTGWARNTRDGAVEALLAGEAEVLRSLIDLCRTGPRGAVVAAITEAASAELPPSDFAILRDR